MSTSRRGWLRGLLAGIFCIGSQSGSSANQPVKTVQFYDPNGRRIGRNECSCIDSPAQSASKDLLRVESVATYDADGNCIARRQS